jgi:hypothetical protein
MMVQRLGYQSRAVLCYASGSITHAVRSVQINTCSIKPAKLHGILKIPPEAEIRLIYFYSQHGLIDREAQ